jgi:hypothetical protein
MYHLLQLTPYLRGHQSLKHSRISQRFMELEGSLPCSHEPSTGPYSEPDQARSYHTGHICLRFVNINLPPRLRLPSGLFPSGFPTNILHAFIFSTIRATCPAHPNYNWRRIQVMKLLIMQFSLHPSSVQIFSSAHCFRTPSLYVPSLMSESKLSAKLVPTLMVKGCRVVCATNPHGR